jgi:hypothetical protein
MRSWSGNQIDAVSNIANRKIYMQVGSADTTVGPNVMNQLKAQLANFDNPSNFAYITTNGAAHTFPTDFNGSGDNACSMSASPYISNCAYDGAGAVLQWMYGTLAPRNSGTLSGTVVSFDQNGTYGASGMDTTGYLYVPAACQQPSTVCKLHVAMHGCLQSHSQIGSQFIDNTGYIMWAGNKRAVCIDTYEHVRGANLRYIGRHQQYSHTLSASHSRQPTTHHLGWRLAFQPERLLGLGGVVRNERRPERR